MLYQLKVRLLTFLVRVASRIFKIEIPPIPSTAAIIEKDGKILVVNLTYRRGYALPGGVLKGNENFSNALKREIKEETGYSVTSSKFLNTYYDTSEYPKVVVTYKAKVRGKLLSYSKEGVTEWMYPKDVLKRLAYRDNKLIVRDFLKNEKNR